MVVTRHHIDAPIRAPDPVRGGITVSAANDCSAPGSNVLHLRWTENGFADQTFIANYRYVTNGADSRIIRYTCSRVGAGAFTPHRQ